MLTRVRVSRIALFGVVACLASSVLWARGGNGSPHNNGGGAGGGFRGGAGGRGGAPAATGGAPATAGAPHPSPGPGAAPPSGLGPHHGAAPGTGPGMPAAGVPQNAVGIHGNSPASHGAAIGGNRMQNEAPRREVSHGGELRREAPRDVPHGVERRFEGPHGGPGLYRAEMMHSPGAHWNGYHQAYVGHHPIHLANQGYYPSYYHHPWYHGPWGGHPWGWGWGFGPGVAFGFAGDGWGVSVSNGWGYPAYYGPYGPDGYWGRPLGWGFGGWGLGTTVYSSGYYVYENPYYSSVMYPTVVYDYSRPIPVMTQAPQRVVDGSLAVGSPPASPSVMDSPEFDAARESFRRGNYSSALAMVDAAIRRVPSDAVMHEFRSLVLFAMRDYRQSAAVAHSVLAVGPGWDYTTMSSLYPNPFVYSDQLRLLEDYTRANPRAADAHFLLAYHNMINSRKEAAIEELKQVIHLMPSDKLASELLAMVQGPPKVPQQASTTPSAPVPQRRTTFDGSSFDSSLKPDPVDPYTMSAPAVPAKTPLPAIDKTRLAGTWSAAREDGSRFQLTLTEAETFTWKFSNPNQKGEELSGHYTVNGPVLVLERKEGGALAGTALFSGEEQMNFKLVGAPPEDKGLDFSRE